MKEKILVALKTKYRNFGFGDKAFDGVADYLSKTVTEEGQIETAIGGVEGLLKAFQGDIDTVRNEKSGLQKQLDELKNKNEDANPPANQNLEVEKEEIPVWAQTLIESNKSLLAEVSTLKQEKLQATRREQILIKANEYGIPKDLVPMLKISDDVDLDNYMKDARQTFANVGFEVVKKPESGDIKEQNSNDIANLINKGTKEIVEQSKN